MAQHFTKLTIEASEYCKVCRRETVHNVQGGRLGACQECLGRRGEEKASREAAEARQAPAVEQLGLFGGAR
jgi:hypothetical protein